MNIQHELDTSTCDNEAIHLLGKIQSDGYLFAFDKDLFTLSYVSSNIHEIIPADIALSKHLHLQTLFGGEAFQFVKKLSQEKFTNTLFPHQIIFQDQAYRCYFADGVEHIIAELEVHTSSEFDSVSLNNYHHIIENIRNAPTPEVLYATVVYALKKAFGFDRAMMYAFDEQNDGLVVAEEKERGLESFLGLKYPASDIPKQARRLYLSNLSRAINDLHDEGLEIRCLNPNYEGQTLDLSYAIFRSVSPIHIQYMQNMGVRASHAVSLVIDNKLWGMILLHHYQGSKRLNFAERLLAQTIGINTAQAIELLETKKQQKRTEEETSMLHKISARKHLEEITEVIIQNWDRLSAHFKVCGFSFLQDNKVKLSYGDAPAEDLVNALHHLTQEKASAGFPTSSRKIKEQFPEWTNKEIAGYLQIAIAANLGKYLYLWRKVKSQTVNWAGNPEKTMSLVETNNRLVLTPRSSFALWQENIKDESLPWQTQDLEFASKLSNVILDTEIRRLSEVLIKQQALKNEQNILEDLLKQKSEELYKLNLKLQEELQENKKYQHELELAKTAGEQLNKLKSNFIANMSHEIRTPINGIIGLARLLTDDPSNTEDVQTFSELILESADRLLATINRILSVSRIENNAVSLEFENTNIPSFLRTLLKPLSVLAKERGQNLVLNIHNEQLSLMIDKHYFGQIFTNLVSNAIKYTAEQGYIEINLKLMMENSQELLYLAVEDNGFGIEKSVIDKIFDPFFTEGEASRVPDNSSGLGLYLVKNYVQYLGGKIEVESQKGKGSKFWITIPILPNI